MEDSLTAKSTRIRVRVYSNNMWYANEEVAQKGKDVV